MMKKIGIVIGIIWILFFTMWVSFSTVLVLKRDDLGKFLLLHVNQIQNGELEVEKVLISPIRQFPHISIQLENVTYYEHKTNQRKENELPIAKIENFFCGFEIIKLLKGELNITKVSAGNGEINFVIYPDSSINLLNAIKRDTTLKNNIPKIKSSDSDGKEFSISVEDLAISDLRLNLINDPVNKSSSLFLKYFNSSFDFNENKINLRFDTETIIENLKISDAVYVKNQELKLKAVSHLDRDKGLQVDEGLLEYGNSTFNFTGHFDPDDRGDLSIKIVSDGSLNILSSFINEDVSKNLHKGKFYFFGSINGKVFSEFPHINFDFGFADVELTNPLTNRTIKNFNMKGFFNSGTAKNLSEAVLKIDTLYADFPIGQLKTAGLVKNFTQPEFDINVFANPDFTGLDEVFNLEGIDSLRGKIILTGQIKGKYNVGEKKIFNDTNKVELVFSDFGFKIPGTIKFDKINGTFLINKDEVTLQNVNIKSDATDFNINGNLENINYLIFNIEKEINAQLAIKSSTFDLPNFLSFDPSIKRDFPHRILNLDLLVNVTTTTSKALHFKSFPQINFDIKKLNTVAEGFLPHIDINSGKLNISEDLLGFHMAFKNFETNFLNGKFDFTADYNSSVYQPYHINSKIKMDGIEIKELTFSQPDDSIPDFYKSKMYGSLQLELQFADDSTEIKLININDGNINYFYGKDSIVTRSLKFTSEKIDYSILKNPNPLATLFASGNLKADQIQTSLFFVNDVDFNFTAANGDYIVETKKPKFFGDNSKGEIKYFLKPFAIKPSYRIVCNITSFNVKEMMYTFLKDTTFSGNLSLNMDVSLKGTELEQMLETMNGNINLSGTGLVYYGVDADKLIEEFQRSQNFNLVDAGAVLLAGPVGLAVTKGSDFAKILIAKPGELTYISQLVSNWDVNSGDFNIRDVAASTEKNRVAAKGWINLLSDSLNIAFAVIDDNGCSIFTQNVYGDLNKPILEKVKVVKTILAPVTNLYNSVMQVNCPVFYKGSLLPLNKK